MHSRLLTACALVLIATSSAVAAEGVLPIRAGDSVEGEVRYCGDRHVLRVDLVRGERFRVKVGVQSALLEDITLRLYDPNGHEITAPARVRSGAGTTHAGPYRVRTSGSHLVQITTFTRHEIPYEVRTSVRGRRARSVRLSQRRERSFVAAAGSLVRMRGADDGSTVTLVGPSGARDVIEPGSAALTALLSGGLTLPAGGRYSVGVADAKRKPRLRIKAPRRSDARSHAFPELPDDRTSVSSWYDDTGWTQDPGLRAPADHEPPVSRNDPDPTPPAGPTVVPLSSAPTAPTDPAQRTYFGNEGITGGHEAGVGMPLAPRPDLDAALERGVVESFADGPSYVYDVNDPDLGRLRYRVHFVVGGRASLAPLVIDGLVGMRWTVDGLDTFHDEEWTLTFDGARAVEVLQGSATRVTNGLTTVRTVSTGYTTPIDGALPRGTISWAVDSPVEGAFSRTETHDGDGNVTLDLR